MTAKIFIGYRTRPIEGFETLMPEFKAPSNWKDEKKIAALVEEKKADFIAEARDQPYTGTFDEVFLSDPLNKQVVKLEYRPPDSGKQPISLSIRSYLMQYWRDAWAEDTHGGKLPAAIFVGFDPRTFLKILGLECSMPAINNPLPLRLWYSNTDHRDISEAVLPKEFKSLTIVEVLKARRPVDPKKAALWDKRLEGWPGPGHFPQRDVEWAIELATQIGLLER